MKTRYFLVSNSSSTSFIIAYKKGIPCKCCGRTEINLAEKISVLEDHNHYNTKLYGEGSEKILQDIECWIDSETFVEIKEKLEKLPEDFIPVYFTISMHDENLQNDIDSLIKRGAILIYTGEG